MIHIYTGDGKGKTTAAFGLALRAAGAGMRVYICQFMKDTPGSEVRAARRLKNITVEQYGAGGFIRGKPRSGDIKAVSRGFRRVAGLLQERRFDLYILDEIIVAVHFGLIELQALLDCIARLEPGTEVVLTGRKAGRKLLARADLVTEMRQRKHYYDKGVKARRGIEY